VFTGDRLSVFGEHCLAIDFLAIAVLAIAVLTIDVVANIEDRTRNWVKRVVVGLNLCPFANAVVTSGNLALRVETSNNLEAVLTTLAAECENVLQASDQFTVLLVLPLGFDQFDDYLDLVELAQRLLAQLELDEHLQLASFHPHYQFNDTSYDDAANYTNRSPYPMLHILQEDAVEKAITAHPDTTAIPQRNIDLLQNMAPEQLHLLITDENNQHEK